MFVMLAGEEAEPHSSGSRQDLRMFQCMCFSLEHGGSDGGVPIRRSNTSLKGRSG